MTTLANLNPVTNFDLLLQAHLTQSAAGRLSISRATARTHLSRIFDNAGTRQQAE